MRARLPLLAAGVVAVALLFGGPLWVCGVRYRMLEDLRERDRTLAAMTALVRVGRAAGLMVETPPHGLPPPGYHARSLSIHGVPPGDPGSPPPEGQASEGPVFESFPADLGVGGVVIEKSLPPGTDSFPKGDLGLHHGVVVGIDALPRIAFPKSDLLVLTPDGEVESTGREES